VAGLALAGMLATTVGGADARAEFVLLRPLRDSTLVEDPSGALANGSGQAIFAGRINSSSQSIRRALLAFDVGSAVPSGSTVTGVRLWLNLSATVTGPVQIRVHRVLADWGEGASSSGVGLGAPAAPGDSTWIHRFYGDLFWTRPGGDFDPAPRGDAVVDQPGPYTWGSTPEMVADVQLWLDQPDSAFGWILLGDETRAQSVKRFDSREFPEEANRPVLEVDFVPPCSPDTAGPGYWRRQCPRETGAAPAGGSGLDSAGGEPAFAESVLPCANRLLADLGLPWFDACGALLSPPPLACGERAAAKVSVLAFNICAGRLQSSCPVESARDGCSATTVGELLREISVLVREGNCRRISGCAGSLD
jgi:hypothetical protein